METTIGKGAEKYISSFVLGEGRIEMNYQEFSELIEKFELFKIGFKILVDKYEIKGNEDYSKYKKEYVEMLNKALNTKFIVWKDKNE